MDSASSNFSDRIARTLLLSRLKSGQPVSGDKRAGNRAQTHCPGAIQGCKSQCVPDGRADGGRHFAKIEDRLSAQRPLALKRQSHLREHVARVVGRDVDAETRGDAYLEESTRDRVFHRHLQLGFGGDHNGATGIGDASEFVITEEIAVDVKHVRTKQAGVVQLGHRVG